MRIWIAVAACVSVSCVSQSRTGNLRPAAAPVPPSAMERQIRNALDAGDGDYRIRALRQRVASEPENATVRLELARAYREAGYPDVALEHCRLAAARFPDSAEVNLALARALRDVGLRKEAIEGLETFLKAHPQESPQHLSWLGILRDETGALGPAEAAHRAALELAPGLDYLHNNLGYNLLLQKKNSEAAAEFREALRLNPASQLARNNLGTALANQGARDQAVANWQSAADPAVAHNNMAAVLIEGGNYADARKELDVALGYNRAQPAALKNLELVSRLDGDPATLTARQPETRWSRFKIGFKRLFVGPLGDRPAEAVKAASAK